MTTDHQYLAHATCVVTFAIDKQIRYQVADIERAFQDVLGGQATGTNVADTAPPAIPRSTMQSGPKQFSISQITAQLDLDFFSQKKSFESLSPVLKKNFNAFWSGICKIKSRRDIRDLGVVITINTPSSHSTKELNTEIFNRYVQAPMLGQVASTTLQLGFLDTDMQAFINVAVGAYEIREAKVNDSDIKGGQISILLEDLPISEGGIETKIDVNSKPMVLNNNELPENLDEQLFTRLESLTTDRFKHFLSW